MSFLKFINHIVAKYFLQEAYNLVLRRSDYGPHGYACLEFDQSTQRMDFSEKALTYRLITVKNYWFTQTESHGSFSVFAKAVPFTRTINQDLRRLHHQAFD